MAEPERRRSEVDLTFPDYAVREASRWVPDLDLEAMRVVLLLHRVTNALVYDLVVRLRSLLRRGVTLLVGDDVDPAALQPEVLLAGAPVSVHRAAELSDDLPEVLGLRPDEVWVIRPDAHVAAVATEPCAVRTALSRLLAQPQPVAV